MRRFLLLAPVILVLLVLTACSGANTADTCDEITRTVGKPVITATDMLAEPFSATSLEAAGDEIEGYLAPLRELNPQGKLVEPHRLIIEGMDELLIALRAGDTDRISDAASELAKTAVDVDVTCG